MEYEITQASVVASAPTVTLTLSVEEFFVLKSLVWMNLSGIDPVRDSIQGAFRGASQELFGDGGAYSGRRGTEGMLEEIPPLVSVIG